MGAGPAGGGEALSSTIFTIGHSTRPIEELVELLRRNGVHRLVDVRRYPGSRRHPQFNAEALARSLDEAGIAYRHAPGLGGRRGNPTTDANAGWRNASFRAYADHMSTPAFAAELDRLVADAAEGPVAVMCAEAVPWRCHRQLISDALVARGHPVRHIISDADPSDHELNAMARVDADGRLTYPGDPPSQPDLFG